MVPKKAHSGATTAAGDVLNGSRELRYPGVFSFGNLTRPAAASSFANDHERNVCDDNPCCSSRAKKMSSARERLGVYRREAGRYLIEIRLRELRQLFNTLDPAPFHEKDLDPAAEEYLVSAVRELGRHPGKLILHIPAHIPDEQADGALCAIRNYFAYRSRHTTEQLRLLLGRGGVSLLVGLAFLTACLLLQQLLVALSLGVTTRTLSEGLLILGWVAMWRPVEIFLYDWWPEVGKRRLFDRLARMPMETSIEAEPATIAASH